MQSSSITKDMVVEILTHERFPVRFEDFCAKLFSDVEGIQYVTTSVTWDHGRDGRAVTANEGQPPFLCCGTEEDIVKKAGQDTKRICEDVSPSHISYCFTDPKFSEHKAIEIEKRVREIAPTLRVVRSYGADQLADLTIDHPQAFEHFYQGELANLRNALATPNLASEQVELTGLRLALTTQLTDDGQARRRDLISNLVLTALASGDQVEIMDIAKSVSERLHLPKPVNEGWLQASLNELVDANHLECVGRKYFITEAGRDELKLRSRAGSKVIADGQTHIQQLIETLTGHKLTLMEWQLVWTRLQEGITTLFLSHGATIVESIESIVTGKTAVSDHGDFQAHIARIAQTINLIPGQGDRIQEIAQAVSDMFHEKQSPAFAWLTGLCEVYIHLCALGLEPATQQQILSHLQEIELLIDTDAVLSLLSSGDENHLAIETILGTWKKVGGALHVAEPVLEESAHHAWISEYDYEQTCRIFDKLTSAEAQQSIENAFVRGYWTDVKSGIGTFTRRSWNQYIGAFRGKSHLDYEKIQELLYDQDIELLPDAADDAPLAQHVAGFLFDRRKGRIGSNAQAINDLQEKSHRDGRLIDALIRRRKELAKSKRTCFVISTSLFLRDVGAICPDLRQSTPVLSVAAIGWLLSLVPGVRMSASSMRNVLFDIDFSRHLSSIERVSLRILRISEEYQFHYSRRSTLKRAVRDRIHTIASQENVDDDEVSRRFVSTSPESDSLKADVIASAIDSISLSKSERQVAALQQRIRDLEMQLARQRGQTEQ